MTAPKITIPEAYVGFKDFDPMVFNRLLTPRDRKIVLREIEIDTIRRIGDFAESFSSHPNTDIGVPAVAIAHHAHNLARYLTPKPGPDRMFMSPQKAKMRSIQMPGSGMIPSMDNELERLSIHMLSLARQLSAAASQSADAA